MNPFSVWRILGFIEKKSVSVKSVCLQNRERGAKTIVGSYGLCSGCTLIISGTENQKIK